MRVQDAVKAMERIAPLEYAEAWDRVGLHVGRGEASLRGGILLTIDLTERVMYEAEEAGVGLIIAYHPPIWEALARVTDTSAKQRVILRAIERGIAIYSPHTALDAVEGGMTDWLCEGLSGGGLSGGSEGKILGDCRALKSHARIEETQQVKIVTFVPSAEVDRIRSALATAGAGLIGDYSVCSFSLEGNGTFLGGAGAAPAAGKAGSLESVREVRLEMVCSKAALALAIQTLEQFHPYEEPALDVYELMPKPARRVGAGRRLVLDRPIPISELAARLKKHIARENVRVACADINKPVSVIGVCPGAGAELVAAATKDGCEVFVTGEMKHHEVMSALDAGVGLILGEHTSTERGYLARLAARLEKALPGVRVSCAMNDVDPVRVL
ncbi:MAG: Nif3-like dinuclear metal center hexameric protein [Phycisphaeraceae bacterium]|nr:Nif3-like dinuclear metal center hexameric protein [Phycisphaeraceae bacterium]